MDIYQHLDMLGRMGGGHNSAVLTIDRRVITGKTVRLEITLMGGGIVEFFGDDIGNVLADALDYFINDFCGEDDDGEF